MKKMLIISLCTTGVMREHFIYYAKKFSNFYDVYCVTNDNIDSSELNVSGVLNLRYKRKEMLSYFSIKQYKKIKKYITSIGPDYVYVFTPHPVNILMAAFLKKYNLIFQVHDPKPHSGTSLLERLILRIQLKQYYKYSKVLFVAGDDLKDVIIKENKKLASKIEVVPFGVLDNLIFENIKKEKKYDMLFFGRIEYYKGIDTLLDALEILQNKYKCLIVGKGDISKACSKNVSLPENVTFINRYVSDEELIGYINESRIVVLPYRDATGSMTIGISYCYGIPVIASNVGVFPEYVLDGGLIFEKENPLDLSEKIEKLLSNNELIEKLSFNAQNIYSNKYDISKVICKTVEFIEKHFD